MASTSRAIFRRLLMVRGSRVAVRQAATDGKTEEQKKEDEKISSGMVRYGHIFDQLVREAKNRESFEKAIGMFLYRNAARRGHIEFIEAALKQMVEYGVQREVKIYKKLLELFPKGPLIPENMIQAGFGHHLKHQDACIKVIDQMEYYDVHTDQEVYDLVINTFGEWTNASKKMKRNFYWQPKLKNLDPYRRPHFLPVEPIEIAKIAVKAMCRDPANSISVWLTEGLEDDVEKTWIVSGQSIAQREIIERHPKGKPLYVDGPSRVWVKDNNVNYFTLTADADPDVQFDEITDNIMYTEEEYHSWRREYERSPLYPSKRSSTPVVRRTIHEQQDGTVLSICVTGSSSKDSAAAWIGFLQRHNPRLSELSVVFRMKHVASDLKKAEDESRVESSNAT